MSRSDQGFRCVVTRKDSNLSEASFHVRITEEWFTALLKENGYNPENWRFAGLYPEEIENSRPALHRLSSRPLGS